MAMTQGFGRGRRALIGVSVLASIGVALVIWVMVNYLFTLPKLRTSLDMSPGAQFTISPATQKLIASLREKETVLEIDTLFLPANADPNGLQESLLGLTKTLLGRISYLGGDRVVLKHLDYMRHIKRVRGMGATQPNIIRLTYGKRKRNLTLLTQTADGRLRSDLADIENPAVGGPKNPGQANRPVLRAYKGEEAMASALKELLSEEVLRIYWTKSHLSYRPDTPPMAKFVRDLNDNGFNHALIDLETEAVPKDCDVLFLIQPGDELKRDALDRVHAYLDSGGRILMTVSYSEDEARQGYPQVAHRDFLQGFGLSLGNAMLLNGIPDPAGGQVLFRDPKCSVLLIRSGGLNPNHPVTKPLVKSQRYVDLFRARPIQFAEKRPEGVFADFLLHSNRHSFEETLSPTKHRFTYDPQRQDRMGPRTVAATVELKKKGRFALISGWCLVSGLAGQAGSFYDGNRDFALNLVNWLVQRDRLVTVRSRDYRAGRLEVSPQGLSRIKTFLVFVLPFVFLGMAFLTLYWRRRA